MFSNSENDFNKLFYEICSVGLSNENKVNRNNPLWSNENKKENKIYNFTLSKIYKALDDIFILLKIINNT